MDQHKLVQMVREFPFLADILAEQNLSADSIGSIKVARGDRNLLKVAPSFSVDDAGVHGSFFEKSCFFWVAAPPSEIGQFQSFRNRLSCVPHPVRTEESTPPIGCQLLQLNKDVRFIVEIHEEYWDWQDNMPSVVIYKMDNLDWHRHASQLRP